MSRISKDDVSNRFTAKDLIGSAVYDPAGERIGDIADIDLRGAVPGSLMMSYSQARSGSAGTSSNYPNTGSVGAGSSQAGSNSSMTSGSTSGTSAGGTSRTGTGTTPGQSGTYAQSGTTSGQTGTSSGSSGSSLGSSASDALRDSSRAVMAGIDSSLSNAAVFVSVGGLFGIGDDLVSVPVSMLTYNTSKDHFEVSASKAEVVALTENSERNAGFASSTTGSGTGMGSSTSGTTAGKQSFGDEVTRVQSALRTDPKTSSFAHNVMVSSDGDTIELRGSVESNEQKQQIMDAARRATSLKIDDDELDVRK